ncbi:MAG: gliding motility-associated C-terminal domain-containing protein [Bacteroidota bacterium]
MNRLCYCFFLMMLIHSIYAQNLVSNPDFEFGIRYCDLPNTPNEEWVENWRNINERIRYQQLACNRQYGRTDIIPQNGEAHMTLGGRLWINGVQQSDVLVAPLTAALQRDTLYYLEFYERSRGIYHVSESDFQACNVAPPRTVEVLLGNVEDELRLEKEFGEHLMTAAELQTIYRKVDFSEELRIEDGVTNWEKQSTCFRAKGGEENIAFAATNRAYNNIAPCLRITDEAIDTFSADALTTNRIYHFFDYDIDNIQLYAIPDELEAADTICRFQENTIYLRNYLPKLSIFEQATFQWSDGSVEEVRLLEDGGSFEIAVLLPCTIIPLTLQLETKDCPPPVYIPNIIRPNEDGRNDTFLPKFNSFYELVDYELIIYDRWGNIAFQSTDPDMPWKAKSQGRVVASGVYYWQLRYQFVRFSNQVQQAGTVTVVN